ncbi:5'-nucleotidase, lipoprotein e(P4) family [Chryseobacterium indologenes]|uniref:5'-nucleotidase, lipoprotein e(P4) family n=1 Tax=Chryseobacterium indologenes TaxID=253 RepID=UPI000B516075|nr:5'-nucleotidase, lipoprotein e(P4) family [Chryseobacterium indologenes]ASE60103.1 5'-nucleotidase, lipoprotein e(P4) family [Chryseobacterium indologenes]VFA43911.1 Outer membrane protein P4 [Chryseobacterium indologenes]
MKNLNFIIASCLLAVTTSCKTVNPTSATTGQNAPYQNLGHNGKIYSAFYQQRAAEYEALCLQAYNIAKFRLDEALAQKSDKPLAIVSDIDETFLDNSYYAVERSKMGKNYDQKTWEEWTAKGIATPLTGAQEFYQYAASKGVQVFYITNRAEHERAGTLKNLKKYNFPIQNDTNLILRSKESSKENRRNDVAKNYNIVLLLGDNLSDFAAIFDKKTEAERSAAVKSSAKDFGKRFIIIPNTGYGDWESSFYNYRYDYTDQKKDSLIYNSVKSTP